MKFLLKERAMIPFGCTTRETKLFLTQEADGILGLGPGTGVGGVAPNFVDAIWNAHNKDT